MTTTPINDTSIASGFNVDELTEGSLTGKGVLDVLLQTLRLHLDREFTSGRITGTAYATVYAQAITAFLAQAAQYALSKAKLPLELQLLEKQITLAQKQQDQITAAIRQTDYVTDYQLPSEVANKTKQTELLAYELTNIKPVELSIAQQDLALKTAQADLVEYDLTTIKPQELALLQQQVAVQLYTVQTRMPAEVANIQAETALKAYDLTDIKPTEKAQITQQTSNLSSQQEQIVAETSRVLYQVNYQLPEEVTLIKRNQDQVVAQTNKVATDTVVTIKQGRLTDAQTCQVQAETNQVNAVVATKLPKEVAQIEAQTSLLAYDLSDIKPVEKSNLISTGLGTEAQTANTTQTTANLVKQGNLIDSQKVVADKEALSIEAETALKAYDLTDIKPTQKAQVQAETSHIGKQELNTIQQTINLTSQKSQVEAQTAQITYTTANLLPSQLAQTTAQTSLLTYDLSTVKPAEVVNLTKQGILLDGQKTVADKQALSIEAETAQVVYKTTYVVPEEVKIHQFTQDRILAEVNKLSNETVVSIKQGRLVDAQVAQTTYTTSNVLPAQVALTNAQKDSANAQTALYAQKVVTEQAQATNAPAATSVMGVQNALMEQQKNQIIRDAEQKTAKIMLDSWQTIFTTDQTLPPTGDIALLLTHTNAAKLKMLQGVGAV